MSHATPRARELGLPLSGTPGPHNAITDVPGIEVGYETVIRLARQAGETQVCSGVTAVLPRGRNPIPLPVWAGQFDFNGNGEMTGSHWIRDAGYFVRARYCLTNTHAVGVAHHAAVRFMMETYSDHFHKLHDWAMPVVAETYDGLVSDICGLHVTEQHALAALHSARAGSLAEGNVGGGTGMATYEFKGGTGTSSRCFEIRGQRYTVGVLVQSNFGKREELTVLGVPVGQHLTANAIWSRLGLSRARLHHRADRHGCAADADAAAPPGKARRARHRPHRNERRPLLGRSDPGILGRQCDLSTGDRRGSAPIFQRRMAERCALRGLYPQAVAAVEEAILNALVAARSVPTYKPPGYVLEALDHESSDRADGSLWKAAEG